MRKFLFILSALSVFSFSQASQTGVANKSTSKPAPATQKKAVVTKAVTKKISAAKSKVKLQESAAKTVKSGKKLKSEKMLSYYQWRELSKKDQAKYIRGLQKIAYRWEEGQRSFGITHAEQGNVNKWALLSEILINPSRAADPPHCKNIKFNYSRGEVCYSGLWWWSRTYCSKKVPEANMYPTICKDKFKKFAEEHRATLIKTEDIAEFDRTVNPYLSGNAEPSGMPRTSAPTADTQSGVPDEVAEAQEEIEEAPQCSEGSVCSVSESDVMTEERRQAYRAEMNEKFRPGQQPCVIAGFISVLNENKKCVPVRQRNIGRWAGNCGSGETMCNPLLFGFSREGQPLCVSLHMNVTAECHEETARYGNTPEVIAAQLSGNSGIESLNRITTEDFADSWQAQRTGMGQLCTERTQSLSFFCVECGIMNSRIRQINQSASCADQCGRIAQDGPCSGGSTGGPTAPSSEADGAQ